MTTIDETSFDSAWVEALTVLEMDVATAEAMLDNDHLPSVEDVARMAAWQPPADLGPLPASLVDRAQALANHQRAVAEAVTRAMIANRRHVAALDQIRATPPSRPVYVDLEG
ncbi:MAG: hypothetical protein FWF02_04410 [Micrococcales bacterium]|nr:hypothetical protein [Micrococcales bacterium]MCL2666934.1 hypothetical protein [Micrococcales bacterium]